MFTMAFCPYCRRALGYMDALYSQHPEYKRIPIEIIDENKHRDIADTYDYYLVPTYYVGDKKLHEGAASMEDVQRVFETAFAE